jgi:hypothetical protein
VVALRPVVASDVAAFYEHQADPVAARVAAFPSRDRAAHAAHWERTLADERLGADVTEARYVLDR